jgi:hypothetical protein
MFHEFGLMPICNEMDKVQSDHLEKIWYFVTFTIKNVPNKSIDYVYTHNAI